MKKYLSILFTILMISTFLPRIALAASGQIDQVSPQTIKAGENVTITGSGFGNTQGSSYVCFGSSCAYSSSNTQSWSDSQIVLTLPSYITSAGTVKVYVSNYTEHLYYTLTGSMTYIAPKLTSVSPKVVYPNQEITLGCGLYSISCFGDTRGSVIIGGQSASIKTWTSYSIVANVPYLNAGTFDVIVSNPAGGQSDPQPITVNAAPTIYSFTPAQVVPGVTRACLKGQNFGSKEDNWTTNTQLAIGNIQITTAAWTDTDICFDVPESLKQQSGVVSLKIGTYQVPGQQSYSIATSNSTNTFYGSKPNDTNLDKQYYLDKINAFNGWTTKSTSENVTVAVIDDGIYINHPEFQQNIWVNNKEQVGNNKDDDHNGYIDDVYGWDFLSGSGEMTVRGNHGTHVAGIIGAAANNGQGIAGITWSVKLMPLIVCDSKVGCPLASVNKAIRYAADNGAQVINLSLGSYATTGYTTGYDDAIRYAFNKGVVIVAAAGNGDLEGNTGKGGLGQDLSLIPQSPVCNDNSQNMVIGVGSSDDQAYRTSWSNYGKCVDAFAPGINIYSTAVPAIDGGYYSGESGTSFSAPMVAGLAALLKGQYPTMPNTEVASRIMRNSTKGIIDVAKTLQEPYTPPAYVTPVSTGSGQGEHPVGTVVLGSDNKTVYLISDGKKRGFATPEEYNSQGFAFKDIVKANANDLALTEGSPIPFADGTLVLDTSDGKTVYIVDDGAKRGFTSAQVFNSLGYKFSQAVKGNLSSYPAGNPIESASDAHPEGALVKNGSTIYKIVSGGKMVILNTKIFNSWKWSMSKVVTANATDMSLPDQGSLKFRDGTLLKTTDGAIYIVSNGTLRSFSSLAVFNGLGFKTSNVISVSAAEITGHEIGNPIN